MASLRIVAFALALLGSSLLVGQASAAMPVNGLTEASKQISSVDKVWCCRGWRGGWGSWMGLPSLGLRPMGLWLPPMVGPRPVLGPPLLGPSVRLWVWVAPLRLASLLVVTTLSRAG